MLLALWEEPTEERMPRMGSMGVQDVDVGGTGRENRESYLYRLYDGIAGGRQMELLELIRSRRSIRKYTEQPVEREKLDAIVEAGLFAPNAGGRQGTKIIMLEDSALIDRIGVVNANCENRNWNTGVSGEQPSIIDDQSIKSGFYGCSAPAGVCIKRASKSAVNAIGTGFVCAENMTLEAYELGVSSVIVGRAEATFEQPGMQAYLDRWGLDADFMPMVFVCLGYIDGPYPPIKERQEGRAIYIGAEEKP